MSAETGARHRRYVPRGALQAVGPGAFTGLFGAADELTNEPGDDVTIVTIRGPLVQVGDWWFDSFESIRRRVAEACAQAAPVVVLRVDSPGGEVAGLFDCARAIRAEVDRAGKRLVAHVEGQCSSAAYALACMADKIIASATAEVGSVGVIAARLDSTAADALSGHRVAMITSGERKGDYNPHVALSDEERHVIEADVARLAAEFFDLVADRRGLSPKAVAAQQAASFRGEDAVKAGLVDELGSFDDLLVSMGTSQTAGRAPATATRTAARAEKKGPKMEKHSKTSAGTSRGNDLESRIKRLEALERRAEKRALIEGAGLGPALTATLMRAPLSEVRAILDAMPRRPTPNRGVQAEAPARAVGDVAVAHVDAQARRSRLPFEQAAEMRRLMGLEGPRTYVASTETRQVFGLTRDDAEAIHRAEAARLAAPPPPAPPPPRGLPPAEANAMRLAMGLEPAGEGGCCLGSAVVQYLGVDSRDAPRLQAEADARAAAATRAHFERRSGERDPAEGEIEW